MPAVIMDSYFYVNVNGDDIVVNNNVIEIVHVVNGGDIG